MTKEQKLKIRKLCEDPNKYNMIRYMSHTLQGEKRYEFIRYICSVNIYLGTLCAATCASNPSTEKYIKKMLTHYFDERTMEYIDPKTREVFHYPKKVNQKELENYMLASYTMGNLRAIQWVLHKFVINIDVLRSVLQHVSDSEYIQLLETISYTNNEDKLILLCRQRTIYSQKNNKILHNLLKRYWNKNRAVFIILAYQSGILHELKNRPPYYENIYCKCLEGIDNSVGYIEMLINSIDSDYVAGLEKLFDVIYEYGVAETQRTLLILLFLKLQKYIPPRDIELYAISGLKDIQNREKYLGRTVLAKVVNVNCSHWLNVFELFYALPIPGLLVSKTPNYHKLSRYMYPFDRYLEAYPYVDLEKIFFTYFITELHNRIYLDDCIKEISYYCSRDFQEIFIVLSKLSLNGRIFQAGTKSYAMLDDVITMKPLVSNEYIPIGRATDVEIIDYDYINHEFYFKIKEK